MTTKPTAVFMAFGTKGDVYPLAAIAAAFASDQRQYDVAFVTHSAHEDLKSHLGERRVAYYPISSPPVFSSYQNSGTEGSTGLSFSTQKNEITRKHRQECISVVERIYGVRPVTNGDLIIINFFALEGWSLAELFHVRCVVAAPYVVPYCAPSSFERQFKKEIPQLYKYLREAANQKIGWEDVIHWMWPLFSEDWGTWRSLDLQLSFSPFTDPVTDLPTWHDRPLSPLLLYGFSKEVVECPGYWPSGVRVCGFWFLPLDWQFSCNRCADISALISEMKLSVQDELCAAHAKLKRFLDSSAKQPIFISLSSVGSMGYMRNPQAFLQVLGKVLNITNHKFLLFTTGYEPLDAAIKELARTSSSVSESMQSGEDQTSLFEGRLFCFSGFIPYNWLFPKCAVAIHHGGSGSTAAALHAGIPQLICPFILDQYYWAERMFWLGVAPEPLKTTCLLPEKTDDYCIREGANVLADAISYAVSSKVKLRALQIAKTISTEEQNVMNRDKSRHMDQFYATDGVSKAVEIIKEEICRVHSTS